MTELEERRRYDEEWSERMREADAFRELVKSHTGRGMYLILVEKEDGELTIRTRKLEKNEIVTVLSAPRYDFSVTDEASK